MRGAVIPLPFMAWCSVKKKAQRQLYFTLLYFTLLYFTLLYFTIIFVQRTVSEKIHKGQFELRVKLDFHCTDTNQN
jgi:hypothetical protein